MCALLSRPSENGYGDKEAMQTFYAMVDDSVPEDNSYLAESNSGRRLMGDAALRELHQVDPIYFDAEGDHGITQHDAIGTDDDECDLANGEVNDPTYDVGNDAVHEPSYDIGSGMGHEPTHDIGNGAGNEPTHDIGAQDAAEEEDIYGIASTSEPGTAIGEAVYGMANRTADEASIYGMGFNVSRSQPDGEETYGLADDSNRAQAVYDNNADEQTTNDNSASMSPTPAPNPAIYVNNAGVGAAINSGDAIYDQGAAAPPAHTAAKISSPLAPAPYVVAETFTADATNDVGEEENQTAAPHYAHASEPKEAAVAPSVPRSRRPLSSASIEAFVLDGAAASQSRSSSYNEVPFFVFVFFWP